jgi:hypothetical protein
MADYFTNDQPKLLNKWKAQKRDELNPEHDDGSVVNIDTIGPNADSTLHDNCFEDTRGITHIPPSLQHCQLRKH